MKKENQFKHKIIGLKLLNEKLKGFEVIFDYNEDEDGHILGILEGVRKMNQSTKKITNQDIMNLLTRKFEDIDKRLDGIDKRLDKMDAKIDLMIQTPTMNREIDHEALAKIDAS